MEKFRQGWENGQRKLANAIIESEITNLADLVRWYKDLEEIAEGKKIVDTVGGFTYLD